MSDFRIKFLGLAALASVFAGMSYGQGTCTNTTTIPSPPLLLRAEGAAELVSDAILSCTGGAAGNGTVTVYASAPVTSKAVTVTGGNSEATLLIGGTPYPGTVSGTTVTFNNVVFPASAFVARVSNIRVNASTLGVTSAPVGVTETIFAGTNGLATVTVTGINVGFALKSLNAPSLGTPSTVKNYTVCAGNPATSTTAPSTSFVLTVAEAFGGAFKIQSDTTFQNGEGGTYVSGANIGTATSGTTISLTFANLPSVATVYLPLSVAYTPTGGTLAAITLTGTPTVASSPASLVGLAGGVVAFTPTSGALTVTYQVTSSAASQIESFPIPVYVSFAANAAAAQGPITVLAAYAPTATLTGQATSIPIFAPTSNTPLNVSSITVCSTSILFPFITNQSGYDTGIAIANTSTDPLGTAGASAASPQSGTCTLTFYGQGAPTPATYTTPTIGATAPATPTFAFTLSGGAAPGFQGYAIAVCNFLYAHGFAFITNSATAGSSGVAQGYVGLVIPLNSRPSSGAGAGEALAQ